jgi:hypothetical protein
MISPFQVFLWNISGRTASQWANDDVSNIWQTDLVCHGPECLQKLATTLHWRQRLSATTVFMLHGTTLNQPLSKKDDLATFISLPLHPQKWQRNSIIVTSTAVDMGAAFSMEEAIAQVSGSSLENCILFMYFHLSIIRAIYCTLYDRMDYV